MKFTKFPKIRQFRDVVSSVKRRGTFRGLDENDQPIYDKNTELPTLTFLGSVKMHGANAAVSKDLSTQEIAPQSRTKIINESADNAGFARYVFGVPRAVWDFLFDVLIFPLVNADNTKAQVTVFGEWIGPGVQKGVGISNIPSKSFVVFGVHVGDRDSDSGYWIPLETIPTFEDGSEYLSGHNIYLITDVAPTYSVDIDFNYPKLIQNKLVELTKNIEDSCPVAKSFGVSGIGEGIVWRPVDPNWSEPDFWFKTKGDKHSASKVNVIAAVDPIKVQNVAAFAELTITERRLEQGIEYLNQEGLPVSRASTGAYIRWVINDVIAEEMPVLEESKLTTKDVGSVLSGKARKWFFNYLDTNI